MMMLSCSDIYLTYSMKTLRKHFTCLLKSYVFLYNKDSIIFILYLFLPKIVKHFFTTYTADQIAQSVLSASSSFIILRRQRVNTKPAFAAMHGPHSLVWFGD